MTFRVPRSLTCQYQFAAKPLFKTNFFPNLCSPFLALVIAALIMESSKKVRTVVFTGVIAGLFVMAIANRMVLNRENTYFREAAGIIEAQKQAGDVLWVPQGDIFRGMAWYIAGHDWGSPLVVGPPVSPQSRRWIVYNRLGADIIKKYDIPL